MNDCMIQLSHRRACDFTTVELCITAGVIGLGVFRLFNINQWDCGCTEPLRLSKSRFPALSTTCMHFWRPDWPILRSTCSDRPIQVFLYHVPFLATVEAANIFLHCSFSRARKSLTVLNRKKIERQRNLTPEIAYLVRSSTLLHPRAFVQTALS